MERKSDAQRRFGTKKRREKGFLANDLSLAGIQNPYFFYYYFLKISNADFKALKIIKLRETGAEKPGKTLKENK